MKIKIILVMLLVVLGVGGSVLWYKNTTHVPESDIVVGDDNGSKILTGGVLNTLKYGSYTIDGQVYKMNDGLAIAESTSSSVSKDIVRIFATYDSADFDNDKAMENLVILQKTTEGTGIFYYVAVAKMYVHGWVSSEAKLLGDRIAIQNAEYRDGKIIVNYADRKPGEPMVIQPSVGVSQYFKYENDRLTKINDVSEEKTCTDAGGNWLSGTKECENGLSKEKCISLGGEFNGCASACRNHRTLVAEVCTQQCVIVCKF